MEELLLQSSAHTSRGVTIDACTMHEDVFQLSQKTIFCVNDAKCWADVETTVPLGPMSQTAVPLRESRPVCLLLSMCATAPQHFIGARVYKLQQSP